MVEERGLTIKRQRSKICHFKIMSQSYELLKMILKYYGICWMDSLS